MKAGAFTPAILATRAALSTTPLHVRTLNEGGGLHPRNPSNMLAEAVSINGRDAQ